MSALWSETWSPEGVTDLKGPVGILEQHAHAIRNHRDCLKDLHERLRRLERPRDVQILCPEPTWRDRMLSAVSCMAAAIAEEGNRGPTPEVRALIDEAAGPGWRPMSEAPRDGRWLLLRRGDPHPVVGWFSSAPSHWWVIPGYGHVPDAAFTGWLPIPGEDGPR